MAGKSAAAADCPRASLGFGDKSNLTGSLSLSLEPPCRPPRPCPTRDRGAECAKMQMQASIRPPISLNHGPHLLLRKSHRSPLFPPVCSTTG